MHKSKQQTRLQTLCSSNSNTGFRDGTFVSLHLQQKQARTQARKGLPCTESSSRQVSKTEHSCCYIPSKTKHAQRHAADCYAQRHHCMYRGTQRHYCIRERHAEAEAPLHAEARRGTIAYAEAPLPCTDARRGLLCTEAPLHVQRHTKALLHKGKARRGTQRHHCIRRGTIAVHKGTQRIAMHRGTIAMHRGTQRIAMHRGTIACTEAHKGTSA